MTEPVAVVLLEAHRNVFGVTGKLSDTILDPPFSCKLTVIFIVSAGIAVFFLLQKVDV